MFIHYHILLVGRRIQTFHRLQHRTWTQTNQQISHVNSNFDVISDSSSTVLPIVLSGNTAYLSKSTLSMLQSPRQALGSSISDSLGFGMMKAMSIVILRMWGRTMCKTFLKDFSDMNSISHYTIAWLGLCEIGSTILGTSVHSVGCLGPWTFTSTGFGLSNLIGSGPSTPCLQLRIYVDSKQWIKFIA